MMLRNEASRSGVIPALGIGVQGFAKRSRRCKKMVAVLGSKSYAGL